MFIRQIVQVRRRRAVWIGERLIRAYGKRRDLQVRRLLGAHGCGAIEKRAHQHRAAECRCQKLPRGHLGKPPALTSSAAPSNSESASAA